MAPLSPRKGRLRSFRDDDDDESAATSQIAKIVVIVNIQNYILCHFTLYVKHVLLAYINSCK